MHYKYMVVGIILVLAVVFGTIFWGDLIYNQNEIANLQPDQPSNRTTPVMSNNDSFDAIEADLNATNVDDVDSDLPDIEAELNAL